ncbi:MAG: oxidoreductase NAD(P)-binding subunit [Tardiphaga sp.]|nr:oxidoreductase NAD(P)-binding subunit [Tardiphaga sp.]
MPIDHSKPLFPSQKQAMPGSTDAMQPRPDYGETSYKGSGRLEGMKAVSPGRWSGGTITAPISSPQPVGSSMPTEREFEICAELNLLPEHLYDASEAA